MHWYSLGGRERKGEGEGDGERERERSTSSHFASHTGAQSRLAFPARERSAPSHICNKPSCLSQKSSLTQLGFCRRLERGSTLSTPRRRREKKFTPVWQRGPRIRCTVRRGRRGSTQERKREGRRRRRHGGGYEARARRAVGCRRVLRCVRAVLWTAPLAPLRTRTS
jgi:hypothetical protein